MNEYKGIVDELEEYANNLINCNHSLCSMIEATNEDIHGRALLNKINKLKETYNVE